MRSVSALTSDGLKLVRTLLVSLRELAQISAAVAPEIKPVRTPSWELLISRTSVFVPVTKSLVCGLEKCPQSTLLKIAGSRFTAWVPKNVLASPISAAPPWPPAAPPPPARCVMPVAWPAGPAPPVSPRPVESVLIWFCTPRNCAPDLARIRSLAALCGP